LIEGDDVIGNAPAKSLVNAARAKALKLRHLVRLYAMEMVRKNFPGLPSGELLDRLIEPRNLS
jgi:hypothetical protein